LKQKSEAEAVSEEIIKDNYIIIRQASDTGQLYGSVNSGDIKEKLLEEGFSLEKNQIILDKPIKEIGYHEIKIRLHPEVTSMISVYISRSLDEAEALISGQNIDLIKSDKEDSIDLEEIFEEGALPNESISEEGELTSDGESDEDNLENSIEKDVSSKTSDKQESDKTDT
jgi:large subunit ribosomal protein L9